MLYNDSNLWLDYTNHILKFEGKTSKNPKDTASKCVPSGQIHTIKGVTFCTFKDRASILGISPVTYERFLSLTDEDVAKFIYSYYNQVQGSKFPDSIGLFMTESGWMSGPDRAWKHLFDGLAELGQKVSSKEEAVQVVSKLPENVLFNELVKIRRQYLNALTSSPKYSEFKEGWNQRLRSFYDSFRPDGSGAKKKIRNLDDIIRLIFNL